MGEGAGEVWVAIHVAGWGASRQLGMWEDELTLAGR